MTTDDRYQCGREYKSPDWKVQFLLKRFFDAVFRVVGGLEHKQRVLEVGCGSGESSKRLFSVLEKAHFEVSDYDEWFVRKVTDMNVPFRVTRESVYALNREDEEFDVIVLLEVLEHLENVDKALSEVFRVAKHHVVISVPCEPLWRILNVCRGKYVTSLGNTPGHLNHWGPWALMRLLERYGKIRSISFPLPWILVRVDVVKNFDR